MFAQINSSRIHAYLAKKHMHMPNVPREINTQSVCAQTHTQKPLPVFKAFGNSKTQGLGFTSVPFYVCGLAGKNHLSPAAAKSSQQGPAFMLPHAAQLKTISRYPIFRHLVLKALLRGIEIWSVNIRGPPWQRKKKDKPCYLNVVMETHKKSARLLV